MRLDIRVIPNASRTAFSGRREGALVLKVNAPARDGKANKVAILYLANVFEVSRSAVHLRSGEKSRHKKFEILGLNAGQAEGRLSDLLEKPSP
jgi:uncharacterized protein (TIGR00251 family)